MDCKPILRLHLSRGSQDRHVCSTTRSRTLPGALPGRHDARRKPILNLNLNLNISLLEQLTLTPHGRLVGDPVPDSHSRRTEALSKSRELLEIMCALCVAWLLHMWPAK